MSGHRVTPNSKRGRQLTSAKGAIDHVEPRDPEAVAWNARVEAKRKAKLERRARREHTP